MLARQNSKLGDNLKILFKNMGFGGGAPKSLYQYVEVAKKNNIEVVVVGEHTYPPTEYRKSNIKTIDLPYFIIDKPLYSFYLLIKYLKIIKKEKPDFIHATTQVNCYFHQIISKVNKIPIIYNIPGGKIGEFTAEVMKGEKLLVYSDENKLELLKFGHDKNNITVISNRIDTTNSNDKYLDHYKFTHASELRLLLISRMSDTNINSIEYIISIVKKLKEDNFNVKLDVLGDGKHFSTIKNMASKANLDVCEEIISLHGFVNNVQTYINKAHIVFGKGRSIIDGIINCRISFVISENKSFCISNSVSFDNLKTYNFAGRNMKTTTTYGELVELIQKLYNNKLNLDYLKQLKKTTRNFYDIKFAEEKILNLYTDTHSNRVRYNPSFFIILKEYILFYKKILNIKKNINK